MASSRGTGAYFPPALAAVGIPPFRRNAVQVRDAPEIFLVTGAAVSVCRDRCRA
jgi:hypothetical protein